MSSPALHNLCDAYKGTSWCQPYFGITLIMKWNEAWLSGSDLDGDGALDRHFGHDRYIGSGAWTTNHMSGWENGEKWVYFVKIVANDTADQDCTATGGYQIWTDFCVVQEVQSGLGVTLLAEPGLGH
jgi:hypothetical protein